MTDFAEIDGCRLAYEQAGEGPPLVLVHGFGLDRRLWEPQVAAFAGRFTVIRYDCRGFGQSTGELDGRYRHGADLRALLEHLGVERATVGGMSMGGQIALELAALEPERVERLVLVDPFLADFDFSEAWAGMWGALAQLARTRGIEVAKETWREGMLFSVDDRAPEAGALLRRMMEDWSGWHLEHPSHFPYERISPRLSDVRAPTLITAGELDLPDFLRIAELLEERIPAARRALLPEAGHVPNLERPEAFNRVLARFLAS